MAQKDSAIVSDTTPLLASKRQLHTYTGAVIPNTTLQRHIAAGLFPAPADFIGDQRHWRVADLVAWRNGKRSGWPPDSTVAERRAVVLARTHGRAAWTERGKPLVKRTRAHNVAMAPQVPSRALV